MWLSDADTLITTLPDSIQNSIRTNEQNKTYESPDYQNAILVLASHEMMNASSWLQFNATIAACVILGFVFIVRGKEYVALLFIVFATITKIES